MTRTAEDLENRSDSKTGGQLGMQLVANMSEITKARIQDSGIKNAHDNLRLLDQGQSLKALRDVSIADGDNALVVSAGPSIRRTNVAEKLLASSFKGAVIATESSMLYCLRHGIVPDLVVTLDPHATRIVRWFGDPALTVADLRADDYFSRQDMDISFSDELRANEQIIELLEKYGKQIRIALSSSSSQKVVQRALECDMDIYWWNPMYDDPGDKNSVTRQLYDVNKLPCVNAGGNVGSACWMMAHAVLGKKQVAVTGMDFGYYADTPYKNTQYYKEAIALVGEENLDSLYIQLYNPHLQQWFYTDPAYMWYRTSFLEMAAEADCITYNCTEGGTLFGDNIEFVTLDAFLSGQCLPKKI